MDNPYYVTPEEAKRKSCPMAKPNTAFHDPRCNGPNCMAWRWQSTGYVATDDGKMGEIFSTTQGYCGMVRT